MGQKTIADLQQRLGKASGSAQAQVQQLQQQMGQASAAHHTSQAAALPRMLHPSAEAALQSITAAVQGQGGWVC